MEVNVLVMGSCRAVVAADVVEAIWPLLGLLRRGASAAYYGDLLPSKSASTSPASWSGQVN